MNEVNYWLPWWEIFFLVSTEELQVICLDLLEAGVETVSNTAVFMLLHIVRDREVQKKLQREIDIKIGHSRCPSLSDRSKYTLNFTPIYFYYFRPFRDFHFNNSCYCFFFFGSLSRLTLVNEIVHRSIVTNNCNATIKSQSVPTMYYDQRKHQSLSPRLDVQSVPKNQDVTS